MRTLLSLLLLSVAFVLTGCDSEGLDERGCTVNCGDSDNDGDGDTDGDAGGDGDDDGDTGGGDDDGGESDSTAVLLTLDPTATYLRLEGDDAVDALPVTLERLGLSAGDTACFLLQGDVDFGAGETSASLGVPGILAVFSRTDELLNGAEPFRVSGALDAGAAVVTPGTISSDLPTDIDQDFDATDVCVAVPDGAAYIFFSAYDAYFLDNSAVGEYAVVVTREPG